MADPQSNALIPRAVQTALSSPALPALTSAGSSIYSDFAALQRHRAEQQRVRNESGISPRQFGLINVNHVHNPPAEDGGKRSVARDVAIGVGVTVGVAAVAGGAYYLVRRNQEAAERRKQQMEAKQREDDTARWEEMKALLRQERDERSSNSD